MPPQLNIKIKTSELQTAQSKVLTVVAVVGGVLFSSVTGGGVVVGEVVIGGAVVVDVVVLSGVAGTGASPSVVVAKEQQIISCDQI